MAFFGIGKDFTRGFVGGLTTSVKEAIDEEQESIDKLFNTQFEHRLKFRLRDLERDRNALEETKKQLQRYSHFTGGDLHQATQLYGIGSGMGHDNFYERLYKIRMAGQDPLKGVIWSQKENMNTGTTLDEYSQALVAPPTALPQVGDLPQNIGGTILGAFGLGDDPRERQSKLMERLQGTAPYRKASDLDVPLATVKEGYRWETPVEETTRETAEETLRQKQLTTVHMALNYPNIRKEQRSRAETAGITEHIAKMTRQDQIGLSRDKAKVAKANASLAELKLTT